MHAFFLIHKLEARSFIRWAKLRPVSTLVVLSSMLLIALGTAAGMYRMSAIFFRNLTEFAGFGDLTATYIIAAATAVSVWFIAASAAVVFTGGGEIFGDHLRFVLSLPVSPLNISAVFLSRAFAASVAVSSLVLLPVVTAYLTVHQSFSPINLTYVTGAFLSVILFGESLGSLAGIFLYGLMRKLGRLGYPFLFAAFMFGTYAILRFLFPPQLGLLFDAQPEEFTDIFNRLPLLSTNLFPLWIARVVTDLSPVDLIYSLSVALLSVAGVFLFLTALLGYFVYAPRSGRGSKTYLDLAKPMRHPVFRKDLAVFVRSPVESGYAVFLFSIAVFFFLMLGFFIRQNVRASDHISEFGAFSLAWLIFFALTFFLRSVFPLMAKEGASAWKLFAAPLTRNHILTEKVKVSLFWAFFWLTGSLAAMALVFGRSGIFVPAAVILVFSLPLLAVAMASLGSIHPNFRDALDSGRLSSTGMGTVAVAIGMFFALGASLLLLWSLNGVSGKEAVIAVFLFALMAILPLILFLVARKQIVKYTF